MLMSTLETGLQTKIPPGSVPLTGLKSWSKNCGIDILLVQSNPNYPDSLGLDEIVRISEGADYRKHEY